MKPCSCRRVVTGERVLTLPPSRSTAATTAFSAAFLRGPAVLVRGQTQVAAGDHVYRFGHGGLRFLAEQASAYYPCSAEVRRARSLGSAGMSPVSVFSQVIIDLHRLAKRPSELVVRHQPDGCRRASTPCRCGNRARSYDVPRDGTLKNSLSPPWCVTFGGRRPTYPSKPSRSRAFRNSARRRSAPLWQACSRHPRT